MLKRFTRFFFLCLAALPWLWWRCFARLAGKERAFQGMSQLCALVPGKTGELFRAAFYRLSLPGSSQQTSIAFLSTFSHPEARLGRHVSTGVCCNIGWADIGDNCILASMVCIASGRQQHTFEDTGIPIRLQGGEKKRVSIGPDCWIGASAVILADIGEGCVIAAGSVVTDPLPPYSLAGGNPARVIRSRLPDADADPIPGTRGETA